MGKEVPGRLTEKRKPNQESFLEKIAENPWAQRGAVLAVAGLGVSSYVKNTNGANKSQERIDALPAYDTAGIKSHTEPRWSKNYGFIITWSSGSLIGLWLLCWSFY